MNSEQKAALQEQFDLQSKRLKTCGSHQKEGIQKLVEDLSKKLEEPTDDSSASDQMKQAIANAKSRLESVKKNPSSEPTYIHPDTGKVLKTKGDSDIEGLEKFIADHEAKIAELSAA